jgi:HAD superfamily hydrolase (TIGR01509 family)
LSKEQVAEFGHLKEQFFRDEAVNVRTIDGLLGFLEDLEREQFALAIASSGSRSRVDFLLDKLGLKQCFRVVITGDEVEEGKPHPAIFVKAAQQLAMDSSQLVVFEDAPSGVKAAKAAGMLCVGIAQADLASTLLDAGAIHVAPDFRSLSCSNVQELFV